MGVGTAYDVLKLNGTVNCPGVFIFSSYKRFIFSLEDFWGVDVAGRGFLKVYLASVVQLGHRSFQSLSYPLFAAMVALYF